MDEKTKHFPVTVRFFREKSPKILSTKEHPISRYLPGPIRSAIFKDYRDKYLTNEHFIVCPVYKAGDIQIGCTGSATDRELPDKKRAMSRELGEEIGILPLSKEKLYRILTRTEKTQYSKKTYTIYSLNLKDCIPVLDSQHGIKANLGRDVRSEKVGCIVYGNNKSVKKLLEQEKIFRYYTTDDITGIATISMKNLLQYINSV